MVDYGIEVYVKVEVDEVDIECFFVDEDYFNFDNLMECLFVVIIMGYVDYGKIIFFDILCNLCVVIGEVGGII